MQSKQLRLFLLIAFLAVAAAIGFFLFGNTPSGPGATDGASSAPALTPDPSVAEAATVDTAGGRETSSASALAKSEPPLPAAYLRALSGIVGRVVEPDGTPVANAPVELIGGLIEYLTLDIDQLLFNPDSFDIQITQQEKRTGKDGRFQFEKVDPRGYFVVGVNLGQGRPAVRFVDRAPRAGEVEDLGDVMLDPPLALVGRVVDEAGRGIAGARIRATTLPTIVFQAGVANVEPGTTLMIKGGMRAGAGKLTFKLPRWTDRIFEKLPTPSTTSGADGAFRLEGAPSGTLTIVVDGAGLPPYFQGPIPPTKSSQKDLGEVAVSRGDEIEGIVVDEKDVPVANAEVMVGIPSPLAKENVAFLRKPITVGAKGQFTAKGIGGRSVVLVARAPDQLDWTVGDTVELTGDELKIKVPAARSLLVRVKDETGKPRAARIAVQRNVEGLSLFPQMEPPLNVKPESIEAGAYRVRGLKQGGYLVYARADGYAIAKATVTIEETGEPEGVITLEPEARIEVTVTGKENGKLVPIEAATVFGAPDKGMEALGFMALGNARTNGQGVATVRALGVGKFNVVATHPAYATGLVNVELPGAKTAQIQLLLGGSISGRVHRAGQPPEKPMMVICAPDGRRTVALPRTSVTDLEGNFKFSHLAPGRYTVVASPRLLGESLTKLNPMELMRMGSENAQSECEIVDEQTTDLAIDLATGGRQPSPEDGFLRGTALVNGLAAEGDYVMAQGPEWVRPHPIDATGTFDLGRVKPGDYTVNLTRQGSQGPFFGALATRKVTVKTGDTAYVEIAVTTGKLRGVVVDDAGKPVSGARVRVSPREKGAGDGMFGGTRNVTDADGKFAFEEIASGSYSVSASTDELAESSVEATVPAGGDSSKTRLVLRPGLVVEGTFDAPLPKEPRWAWMQFGRKGETGVDFTSMQMGQVDLEKKTFRAAKLQAGTYQVTLMVGAQRGEAAKQYKAIDIDVPPGGLANASLRFEEAPPNDPSKPPRPLGR